MLRRLFTPRWLGALLLAVLAAVVCFELGQWQYSRHLAKVERNARMDANLRAAPLPLSDVLDDGPLPIERQWTRVEATGTYAAREHLYVRNRPNHGRYGYDLLAPFRLTDGRLVVVDRGWVANSPSGADVLPAVPRPPQGEVTLVGWALPTEKSLGRTLPEGQVASINTAEAGRAWGEATLGGFVRMQSETGADGSVAEHPEPLEPPDRSLGAHQAYAIQWWLTMALGFALVWFGIRREVQSAGGTSGAAGGASEAAVGVGTGRTPRKVRIWDEEDG